MVMAMCKMQKYENFAEPGQYGDEKQAVFHMDLNPQNHDGYDESEWIKIAKDLKEGQTVT